MTSILKPLIRVSSVRAMPFPTENKKWIIDKPLLAVAFLLPIVSLVNKTVAVFNDTIFCHNLETEDDFPSADDNEHFFPERSIFFIESSCRGGLNSRQACAVESAAKIHPNWQINVLFTGSVSNQTQSGTTMKLLKMYNNIMFFRIHVAKFGRNTPLEHMLASGILNNSSWRVVHTSDVLRFLTLYKWGGVYMDLDVIVMKSFDTLDRNWLARENDYQIGSAYISISKDQFGRQLSDATVRYVCRNIILKPVCIRTR